VYIEGEKNDSWNLGVLNNVPGDFELRSMGEELVESWLSFSYMNDSETVVSPLSISQKEYNIKDGVSNLGKPEIIDSKDDELGFVEVVFGSGCIGKLDLAKMKWVEWEMAGYVPYSPPAPTDADQKAHRELDDETAIAISADFLSVMGYSLSGYKAEITDEFSVGGKTVLLREMLVDTNIDSPNWIRVNVDFWGFIRSFVAKVDKTPAISTRPSISEGEAIEIVRGLQNLSDNVVIPSPSRAIKRVRIVDSLKSTEPGESSNQTTVLMSDTLVWHFDFFGVNYSVRELSISIDAHGGVKVD